MLRARRRGGGVPFEKGVTVAEPTEPTQAAAQAVQPAARPVESGSIEVSRGEVLALYAVTGALTLAGLVLYAVLEESSARGTTYDWFSNLFMHSITGWGILYTGVFVLLAGLAQVRLRSGSSAPMLGTAICLAAVVEAMHVMLEGRFHGGDLASGLVSTEALARLTEAEAIVWAMCRTAAGAVLLAGLLLCTRDADRINGRLATLCGIALGLALLCHLIADGLADHSFGQVVFAEDLLRRPLELLPLGMLAAVGVIGWRRMRLNNTDLYTHGIVLAMVPMLFAHVLLAFGSREIFDRAFIAAHVLILAAYLVCLAAVFIDHSHAYLQIRRDGERLRRESEARRSAEQDHRDAEAQYASLIESLPLAVFRKDREGRFTYVNQKLCSYSGVTPEAMLGKTDHELYDKELADKYRSDDMRIMDSGEPFEDLECHPSPGGGVASIQVLKSPVRNSTGAVIGVQGMFWEVGMRKPAPEPASPPSS